MKTKQIIIQTVALSMGMALAAGSAQAANKYWNITLGYWDTANYWSPTGLPTMADNVYLNPVAGTNTTLAIDGATGTAHANQIIIDSTTDKTVTLQQSGGVLTTNYYEYIGYNGTGAFIQSGGTNSMSSVLSLGVNLMGSGTYTLYGSGSLNASYEYIGNSGIGVFTQSGGTNAVTNSLTLGQSTLSSGTYNLSNTGSLTANAEYIGVSGTGAFTQSGGSNTVTNDLHLGANDGSSGTYTLSGGTLNVGGHIVNGAGTSSLKLDGGALTVAGGYGSIDVDYLTIGDKSGSNGSHTISGNGSLAAIREDIGELGTGTLTQTGGTNTTSSSLILGWGTTGNGTYNLSGNGSLTAVEEYIGYNGTGVFTQTGGTSTVTGQLILGRYSTGNGVYNLSGDGSLSALDEIIGDYGTGVFTQTGGTNNVASQLVIGWSESSNGTYDLQGGTLSAGRVKVDPGGVLNLAGGNLNTTNFNQSGGTVNGNLENTGTFTYDSGTFNGRLNNMGAAIFNADFTAGDGMENQTTVDIVAGRTVSLNGSGLDNQGFMTVDGLLTGNGVLQNTGIMTANSEIGGSGGFINSGIFAAGNGFNLSNTGANANNGTLDVATSGQLKLTGGNLANSGSLYLNRGMITGTATLNNTTGGTISGRGIINTPFANSGGTLVVEDSTRINQDFANSGLIKLAGTAASLTGGALTNTGTIEGFGNVGNKLTNNGTVEALGGTLTLSGPVSNTSTGFMTASTGNKLLVSQGLAGNQGVINLTGGTFDNNNHTLNNKGQISGYGTIRTGGLTNSGTLSLTGATTTVNGAVINYGKTEVAYNPTIFTGDFTNNGFFKLTGTTVSFTANYTENGFYASDPATTNFFDWTIGETGVVTADPGDTFNVFRNFDNHSLENTLWDTDEAILKLTGPNQVMGLAGADLGPTLAGFTNNFAWGTFNLGSGINLAMTDGNDTQGGAFYTRDIIFGDTLNWDTKTIDFITSDFNIYYDPTFAAWLNGETFALKGAGFLMPANSVPEPASMLLIGSGLVGLLGMRRKLRG